MLPLCIKGNTQKTILYSYYNYTPFALIEINLFILWFSVIDKKRIKLKYDSIIHDGTKTKY